MKRDVTNITVTAMVLALSPLMTTCLSARQLMEVASTVPGNGDLNPYGVAVVPVSIGNLVAGHILVSNFNNSSNQQGTGSTIVDISPDGATNLFAQIDAASLPGPCPGGVGLTTALVVLQAGWVIVGSLPTANGMSATAQAGCLIVLDSSGNPVETISGERINGPWDMTVLDMGYAADLFVTNVLNGTVAANGSVVYGGTVVRIDLALSGTPTVTTTKTIGSGFAERTDPAALVIGPTGVGLNAEGTLYVADTLNNRIVSISDAPTRTTSAGTGVTVVEGLNLNAPLGLALRTDGEILALNGNNGYLVEFGPNGGEIDAKVIVTGGNPPGSGALFGLALGAAGVYYVDDDSNTLRLLASQ